MRLLPTLLAIALLLPGTAAAECKTAYTPAQLTEDMSAMTAALRNLDEGSFRQTGRSMEARLPCVSARLPPRVFASVYRYIGAYYYLNQDIPSATRWFLTALELDPTFEWDINDLGSGHPLRTTFDAQRSPATLDPEPIAGKTLNIPAGAELYLDGRPLTETAITSARPHLFQVIAADGAVRQSFIIEGNAIPEQFLVDEVTETVAAASTGRTGRRGKDAEQGEVAYGDVRVVYIDRVRPPAKTPMMLAGGVGLLVGGGLYAASYATYTSFEQASTSDDLLRYQSLTNTLVVASGITAAVGLGVGYAGVMMGSTPGVFFGGHF